MAKLTLSLLALTSPALGRLGVRRAPGPAQAVQDFFASPAPRVIHRAALFEADGDVAELLAPFVEGKRFRSPFVRVGDDTDETFKYDAEGSPTTATEALRILRDDGRSFTLRYEQLAEWPAAVAALVPPEIREDVAPIDRVEKDGGVTVHAYISAPGAAALAEHDDVGDVLVLHLAGEKEWTLEDGTALTLAPGDALWIPAGVRHSARATSAISAHLTIHRITAGAVERRRLQHEWQEEGSGWFGGDDWCVHESHDVEAGCPCNLAAICDTDIGSFCVSSADDVATENPCCGETYWADDDCQDNGNLPADADGVRMLDNPDEEDGCEWVAKDPQARCGGIGVVLPRWSFEEYYDTAWVLANNPRFKAVDLCPITCNKCVDMTDWGRDSWGDLPDFTCEDVAETPATRCGTGEIFHAGGNLIIPASIGCCATCSAYASDGDGSSPEPSQDEEEDEEEEQTYRPTYQPTDQPVQYCANRGDDCDSASECCDGRSCYERRGHEAYGTCETSCPDDDEYACRAENAQPAYQPTYKPTQSGGGDCADDEAWEYLAGDKGPKGCDHVASEPNKVVKRCVNRQSDDGVWAYEACPKTCGTCGTIAYKNWGFQSSGWCDSELNERVGTAKSVGECWDMCEAEYGQSLVAIDLDDADLCFCQTDCQCLDSGHGRGYYVATRRSITELPEAC